MDLDLDIGTTGVVLLALLFLIFGTEDLLIWVNDGVVPGLEFFVGLLVLLAATLLAIREARRHPPWGYP